MGIMMARRRLAAQKPEWQKKKEELQKARVAARKKGDHKEVARLLTEEKKLAREQIRKGLEPKKPLSAEEKAKQAAEDKKKRDAEKKANRERLAKAAAEGAKDSKQPKGLRLGAKEKAPEPKPEDKPEDKGEVKDGSDSKGAAKNS